MLNGVSLHTAFNYAQSIARVIIFDQVYRNLTCHGAKFNVYSWADLFPLWKFSKNTLLENFFVNILWPICSAQASYYNEN